MKRDKLENLYFILGVIIIILLLFLFGIYLEPKETKYEKVYKVEIINDSTANLTSQEEVLKLHFKSAISLKSDSVRLVWK